MCEYRVSSNANLNKYRNKHDSVNIFICMYFLRAKSTITDILLFEINLFVCLVKRVVCAVFDCNAFFSAVIGFWSELARSHVYYTAQLLTIHEIYGDEWCNKCL